MACLLWANTQKIFFAFLLVYKLFKLFRDIRNIAKFEFCIIVIKCPRMSSERIICNQRRHITNNKLYKVKKFKSFSYMFLGSTLMTLSQLFKVIEGFLAQMSKVKGISRIFS